MLGIAGGSVYPFPSVFSLEPREGGMQERFYHKPLHARYHFLQGGRIPPKWDFGSVARNRGTVPIVEF
ncbi:MAG: hypothetical protein D6795_20220 [Deltaproteobacteria bacterium]|nr:MAG: hypothetical protein D6795_20220 [Deltaproteobacteria bacterium]